MSAEEHRRNGASMPRPRAQQVHKGIMEDLTETDLSEGSKDILRNLVSKDLVLAFLNDAEVNEVKWHIRIVKEFFLAIHPDQNCLVTGEDRAAINDDPTDQLEPLSEEQQINVETFFLSVLTRVTRARGMKQQEMMNTNIDERRLDTGDDSGGGLLGRLRS